VPQCTSLICGLAYEDEMETCLCGDWFFILVSFLNAVTIAGDTFKKYMKMLMPLD
jgi:hypothetical protein